MLSERAPRPKEDLQRTLTRIDRKSYKAYGDIHGAYDFGRYTLSIDHVQTDPFAGPSRLSLRVARSDAGFDTSLFSNPVRKTTAADFLTRQFHRAVSRHVKGHRGMGTSGLVAVEAGGQEVLLRNSCVIEDRFLEIRFVVGLPAAGRSVLGREAIEIFFQEIPAVVAESLFADRVDPATLARHVETVEDYHHLRACLPGLGLAAFVADGSQLARNSGVDDRPLPNGGIPFVSPPSLSVAVTLPHRGRITGMGIPRGVTLIVGGGFHGKSTLLCALERAVYPHIPGDGRELVAADAGAVKIRAEDGRYIQKVDISPFITNLPFGRDTVGFCSENASGSTSQAANIMEALEAGSTLLLIDEDTSATNFMIRDERMQQLIAKDKEPITPFVDKVRKLFIDHGVSTILVMGGSGDYFDVADTVIAMDTYRPRDVSALAKKISESHRAARADEGGPQFGALTKRTPDPSCFDPSRGRREVKIDAKGRHRIAYGTLEIDLNGLSQLVDTGQTRAIGTAIHRYATRYAPGGAGLIEGLTRVMDEVENNGLDILVSGKTGDLACPRLFETAAAVNRMRTLVVREKQS
jgi:predicted ABC-class ATPase